VISKQIVGIAKRTGRGIALEDLSGIRSRIRATKKQRRILHSWAFADLQAKIVYKSRLIGVPVQFVDPRNTSRTCSTCGSVSKQNRPTRDKFICVSCGFTANADTNAASNIAGRAAVILPHERDGVRAYVQNPPLAVG
jgi:IS605 OrfB family transposase